MELYAGCDNVLLCLLYFADRVKTEAAFQKDVSV